MIHAKLNPEINVKKDSENRMYFFTNIHRDRIFINDADRPEYLKKDIEIKDHDDLILENVGDLLHDYLLSYGKIYESSQEIVEALKEVGCDLDVLNYYKAISTITSREYFYHVSGYQV